MKELGHGQRFTNVYIKNFGDEMTEDMLLDMFSQFGRVLSHVIMKDHQTNRSRGFGFVSFEAHEAAAMVSSKDVIPWTVGGWKLCSLLMSLW